MKISDFIAPYSHDHEVIELRYRPYEGKLYIEVVGGGIYKIDHDIAIKLDGCHITSVVVDGHDKCCDRGDNPYGIPPPPRKRGSY